MERKLPYLLTTTLILIGLMITYLTVTSKSSGSEWSRGLKERICEKPTLLGENASGGFFTPSDSEDYVFSATKCAFTFADFTNKWPNVYVLYDNRQTNVGAVYDIFFNNKGQLVYVAELNNHYYLVYENNMDNAALIGDAPDVPNTDQYHKDVDPNTAVYEPKTEIFSGNQTKTENSFTYKISEHGIQGVNCCVYSVDDRFGSFGELLSVEKVVVSPNGRNRAFVAVDSNPSGQAIGQYVTLNRQKGEKFSLIAGVKFSENSGTLSYYACDIASCYKITSTISR